MASEYLSPCLIHTCLSQFAYLMERPFGFQELMKLSSFWFLPLCESFNQSFVSEHWSFSCACRSNLLRYTLQGALLVAGSGRIPLDERMPVLFCDGSTMSQGKRYFVKISVTLKSYLLFFHRNCKCREGQRLSTEMFWYLLTCFQCSLGSLLLLTHVSA